jgi:uncharacterized protein (TIGR00255 family)
MINSMTGFGRSELLKDGVLVSVEISSFNNRFCDFQFRLPKFLFPLEPKLKELILASVTRGKINLTVTWEEQIPPSSYVKLNEEVAEVYFEIFKKLKEKYNLSGEIEVGHFTNLPDLIKVEKEETDLEKAWNLVAEAVKDALKDFNQMRREEGGKLAVDAKARIKIMEKTLEEIQELSFVNVKNYQVNFFSRVTELLGNYPIDQQRIAQEAAMTAEKCDITEECVRFKSHNEQFLSTLNQGGTVGKRLVFLLQEMNREANTIGSKASDATISQKVVTLKEELEKIREQVQNIE